ncbi:hypothetical protein [Paenibacillus odorifer]|uniref:hypothetical protein n=1 Tax=Paenibacillus odorifer TaxID=189426 RepID=UPI0015C331B3|nr:hypothetical protein [Paenibacillus odorifer]
MIAEFTDTFHLADRSYWRPTSGLVFAETEHVKPIEQLVIPFRDFFEVSSTSGSD